jgi:hypothetical protein
MVKYIQSLTYEVAKKINGMFKHGIEFYNLIVSFLSEGYETRLKVPEFIVGNA